MNGLRLFRAPTSIRRALLFSAGMILASAGISQGQTPIGALPDFDGDGKGDLLLRNGVTGQNIGWLMNGLTVSSSASPPTITDVNWEIKGIGDVDGNGKADVIWRNKATGQNLAWLMNGLTVATSGSLATITDLNWEIKGVGDFDGNGKADVIWRNKMTGQNLAWLMNGLTVATSASLATITDLNWDIKGVGDFDGNGKADVIWRNKVSGQNLAWLMNGLTVATSGFLSTIGDLNWQIRGVGDFDGNGKADVIWRNTVTGQNIGWLMNGLTVANSAFLSTIADSNWEIQAVGDYSGDGKTDVVWRNTADGRNIIWLMNGLTVATSAFLPTVADINWDFGGQDGPTQLGTLGVPVASLASGIYGPNQTVSLTAAQGATLRFTTDGSTPSAASAIYVNPIALTQTMTVKAQAFQQNWTPSSVASQTYTIDSTPPVITTLLLPQPNAAGWNNTPVTATFTCADNLSGVVSCPTPIAFANDGANQTVTVTVQDGVGNQASVTVVVKIDKSPASVSLTSPSDGATTSVSSVTVTGSVSDVLSGIGKVMCNGVLQTPVDGSVSCTVPLSAGVNSIVLQAIDAAGNSASKGVRVTRSVTPSVLVITPSTQKIPVGQSRPLIVTSESGVLTAGVTWTSSDPTIASVPEDQSGLITGHVPGQVTVTAHSGTLSAEATVVVLTTLVAGDVRWMANAAPPGWVSQPPIHATRVGDSGADLFAVETNASGDSTIIRALRSDGTQLWTENAPAAPLFGDVFGGVIGYHFSDDDGSSTIARFGGPATAPPWRYHFEACICFGVVQAPDGTIYFQEGTNYNDQNVASSSIVGLDGQTGAVKFRYQLPGNRWSDNLELQPCGGLRTGFSPNPVGPFSIGPDGAAYLETVAAFGEGSYYVDCTGQGGNGTFSSPPFELQMLRIDADGNATVVGLHPWPAKSGPIELFWSFDQPLAGPVVPDGRGGMLPTWTHWQRHASVLGTTEDFTPMINRVAGTVVDEHAGITTHDFTSDVYISPLKLVGDDGIAYLKEGSTLTAIDVVTWDTKWTLPSSASPVMALRDRGVAIHDGSVLTFIDANGVSTATAPLVAMNVASPLDLTTWYGRDTSTGNLVAVLEPASYDALFSFLATPRKNDLGGVMGAAQGRGAPPEPSITQFAPVEILATGNPFPYTVTDNYEPLLADKYKKSPHLLKGSGANVSAFLDELNGRFRAFAFIGHSFESEGANWESVGWQLNTSPRDPRRYVISTRTSAIDEPKGNYCPDGDCSLVFEAPPPIPYAARILFFGQCAVGTVFQNLVGIPDTTGTAMIVPVDLSQVTFLKAAALAWKNIAMKLLEPKALGQPRTTVTEAVAFANQRLRDGDPDDPAGQTFTLRFKVIGNPNATLFE
jgi:hypothetical protein